MTPIGRTFRVFVSSTFSDLKAERNQLQEEVFPRLRSLCEQHACRFQAIDLRWGVSEEATLDQQTMNICMEELRRCQAASPRLNFIALLGQRYGWCPLPPQITAIELEELLGAVDSAEDRALLCCPAPPAEPQPGINWYRRDENAYPPEYVLRPREVIVPEGTSKEGRALIRRQEADEWRQLESRMIRILRTAIEGLGWADRDPRRAKYERSATHQEIEAGALSPVLDRPEEHVFCFIREMAELPCDRSAADFIDLDEYGQFDAEAAARLQQLKTELRSRLGEKSTDHDGNVVVYPAIWAGAGPTTDHLQAFGDDVYERLRGVILKEVEHPAGDGDGDPETRAHERFGRARIDIFEGRDDLLERIRAHIDVPNTRPLVLHGLSGAGKTALMAKAADEHTQKFYRPKLQTRRRVICRFIGATTPSTSVRSLLEDLCRQMDPEQVVLPSEIRGLEQEFAKRLAQVTLEQPLVIFLDALDQLGESDAAHSLWWLPTTLPANAKLVVSVLESDGSAGACYRAVTRWVPDGNRVSVGPLAASTGERILTGRLRRASRRLQAAQQTDVIAKFSTPGNGLPLYLKLVFEEARRWRSYDSPPSGGDAGPGLGEDVHHILNDLLRRLARDEQHGALFTERALGYLAAGRQGLTEDEIIDVLSRDKDVLQNFQERSPNSPTVSRLPFIVWSRLRAELEPYLMERQADNTTVLSFYHRQVWDVVETRCLGGSERARAHREIASYFQGQHCFLESIEEQRRRAMRFPPTSRPVNLRMTAELPWQLLNAENWDALERVLTRPLFLEAKTEAGLIFDLALDFTTALNQLAHHRTHHRILRLLQEAVFRDILFIARHPTTLFQCMWNSCWWYDSDQAANHYDPPDDGWSSQGPPWKREGPRISRLLEVWRKLKNKMTPDFVWLRSVRPPAVPLASGQCHVLTAYARYVITVACSPDGRLIAFGGCDNEENVHSVGVWDAERGEQISRFTGHTEPVTTVAFTPDSQCVVSGGEDDIIIVSEAATGREITRCRGHENTVTGVAVTPDGKSIVSGSGDRTIRKWILATGEQEACLASFDSGVDSVALSAGGDRIVTATMKDSLVRVLDASSGREILRIPCDGHFRPKPVFAPDGHRILAGSLDQSIQVWDAHTGSLRVRLTGHVQRSDRDQASPSEVAISNDGTRIVSGGYDETVRLWDAATGKQLACFSGHESYIRSVAFLANGRRVASASADGTVRIWSADASGSTPRLQGHTCDVWCIGISPDGKRAITGTYDSGTVCVWHAETGDLEASVDCHAKGVACATFAPNATTVATGSADKTIRLWEVETGKEVKRFRGHGNVVACLAFSHNGQRIVSGGWTDGCRVWDVGTGEQLSFFNGHTAINCVAFSPDDRFIVSGGLDDSLRIWNADDGHQLRCLEGHTHQVQGVAYHRDGNHVVSWALDGTVKIWAVETGACLESTRLKLNVEAVVSQDEFYFVPKRETNETILLSRNGEIAAWFPQALHNTVRHPGGRMCAGHQKKDVYVIAIEGARDVALQRPHGSFP